MEIKRVISSLARKIGVSVIINSVWITASQFLSIRPLELYKSLKWYMSDYQKMKKLKNNPRFTVSWRYMYPCLTDRTKTTPTEPIYFYQNSWAVGTIIAYQPRHHVDVGSSVEMIGILSQMIPTTMVDIRPLEISLPNLTFKKGSILKLPFKNSSLESVSSICVVEHIGLGRYGDKLDNFGSEKAVAELKRVVKKGGHLLISVPVDSENRIYYNAHRAFTRDYVLSLFGGFACIEEKYLYGYTLGETYKPEKGFGTGLYLFEKK